LIALQRLRVDQALLFLRHDPTVAKITAISDTNVVTQEIVVPPRTVRYGLLPPVTEISILPLRSQDVVC
jgi:hypothetical protein